MTKAALIEAFEAGDIGEVEFFELALETDLSLKQINALIEDQRDDDGDWHHIASNAMERAHD